MATFHNAPHRHSRNEKNSQSAKSLDRKQVLIELYDEKFGIYVGYANHILRSMPEAEDAVAEVFESALHKWSQERFESVENLGGYMYRSVRNHCLNLLKAKQRELNFRNPFEQNTATYPMAQFELEFESLVKLLPTKQRIAFQLFYDGYSHEKIMERMGLDTEGASRNLVYNARKTLKDLLNELPEFDPDDNGPKTSNRRKLQKSTKQTGARGIDSGSDYTPNANDILDYLTGKRTDHRLKLVIINWIINEEFALEVVSGLKLAMKNNDHNEFVERLNNRKQALRNRIFGPPKTDIVDQIPLFSINQLSTTNYSSQYDIAKQFKINGQYLLRTIKEDSPKNNKQDSCFTNNYFNAMEPRKFILDKFQNHIQENYEEYCIRHGLPQTPDRLITYLIDQQLISSTLLQRYTVLCEYEELCKTDTCPKTQAVDVLANRFMLSERTIWSILRIKKGRKK